MGKINVEYLPIDSIRPYENNLRKNRRAVDAVAASIKEYGFNSPILIQQDGTIINGHTRWKAAKKLGMKTVPVIRAEGLTEDQIRKYRLIDNKTSEVADWDKELLEKELAELDFSDLDFDFDFEKDLKSHTWGADRVEIPATLTEARTARKCPAGFYHAIYATDGGTLDTIKTPDNVPTFAKTATERIRQVFGNNLDGWCIVTTPRRRHSDGFHFATAVCEQMAKELSIPFYPDVLKCRSKHRVGAIFDLVSVPKEQNVILYDDIITTGSTLKSSKDELVAAGKTVWIIVSVDNH